MVLVVKEFIDKYEEEKRECYDVKQENTELKLEHDREKACFELEITNLNHEKAQLERENNDLKQEKARLDLESKNLRQEKDHLI